MNLSLRILPGRLAICTLPPDSSVPQRPEGARFWSVTCSDDEISVVLPEEAVPALWVAERGWRCMKVVGPLDFGLIGILASLAVPLAVPLAEAGVSIFAVSTFDTDYVLVRESDLERASQVLTRKGHSVRERQAPS